MRFRYWGDSCAASLVNLTCPKLFAVALWKALVQIPINKYLSEAPSPLRAVPRSAKLAIRQKALKICQTNASGRTRHGRGMSRLSLERFHTTKTRNVKNRAASCILSTVCRGILRVEHAASIRANPSYSPTRRALAIFFAT